MSYKYDICIIDYFPENWLKKSKKSIKCYDTLKFGEKNRKNIEYFPMGHGIAQCDILLNFNSEAKVCVVPISPKTKINQVNIILSKLIRFKTSKVINISFGFFEEENNKHIMQMKKNCIKAEKKEFFLYVLDQMMEIFHIRLHSKML